MDARTWPSTQDAGREPGALLASLASEALLTAAGDLVTTGPTDTNVMDVFLALAAPLEAQGS